MSELRFTGERVVPGDMGQYMDVLEEHLVRYVFAVGHMRGTENVLDAACGTGYGSLLLAMAGRSVLGLDVADEAVDFAREHFSWPGLSYEVADLDAATLPSGLDMVVSFETIEHLKDPGGFVARVAQTLTPDGLFIASIPRNAPSDFHRHVFEWEDARALIDPHFGDVRAFAQSDKTLGGITLSGANIEEADQDKAEYFLFVCRRPR